MLASRLSNRSVSRLALAILLVGPASFYRLPIACASSHQWADACQEIERPVLLAQAQYETPRLDHHVDSEEEKMLELTFKKLKTQDIEGAIAVLTRLRKVYPDNEDYGLLYSMALKRQEAQQWYRYQDWVEARHQSTFSPRTPQFSQQLKSDTNKPGRVNELKRATWLILATGKYPAPERTRAVVTPENNQE